MKANVPFPCSRPFLTHPPTFRVWPANPAPPSGRERIDLIGTRWEKADWVTVVSVMVRVESGGGAPSLAAIVRV